LYAGNKLHAGDRLSLEIGIRADMLALSGEPRYNAAVDSIYGRNTSDHSSNRLEWSPRIGFNWNPRGPRSQLRGGIGVFTGRPPVPWLGQRFVNDGSGVGTLICGRRALTLGPPRPFVADYREQPSTCASGRGLTTDPGGAVNLVDPDIRLAKTVRASLGYDRQILGNVIATLEGMYTRNISDFVFVNLNLADAELPKGSEATDLHGRVMYGTIDLSGSSHPRLVSRMFSEVIDLRNQSRDHSYQIALRLEKPVVNRIGWSAAYAFSRVLDVQTAPSQFSANENWQSGRVVSGRHDDLRATISGLDVPHRIILTGTYTARWHRSTTDISMYYIGESGLPFTYLASVGGRGDLNADGSNLNDPVYIPRSAADTSEIRFAGTVAEVNAQQPALDTFIDRTPCIRRQRGMIMARNSCRAPWSNTTNASVRQSLPPLHGHYLALQLDVFNVLNLINPGWGQARLVPSGANVGLLEQVAQTAGTNETSRSVFRFDRNLVKFSTDNVESAFQLQIGVRYSF